MDNNNIPVHVSIIMDGNGRWAKARGKDRVFGHFEGVKSVRACTEAAVEDGVKYLSLYAFSEENWNRPADEVSTLMKLMMKSIHDEVSTLMDNGVRFVVLGNRERLGEELCKAIDGLMEMTAGNTRMTLIIFLSYSGKWDIMQAMKKAARELSPEEFQKLSMEDFDKYLVTAGIPDPDLLIRTSGEEGYPIICSGKAHILSLSFPMSCGPISASRSSVRHSLNTAAGTADMAKSNKMVKFAG